MSKIKFTKLSVDILTKILDNYNLTKDITESMYSIYELSNSDTLSIKIKSNYLSIKYISKGNTLNIKYNKLDNDEEIFTILYKSYSSHEMKLYCNNKYEILNKVISDINKNDNYIINDLISKLDKSISKLYKCNNIVISDEYIEFSTKDSKEGN